MYYLLNKSFVGILISYIEITFRIFCQVHYCAMTTRDIISTFEKLRSYILVNGFEKHKKEKKNYININKQKNNHSNINE